MEMYKMCRKLYIWPILEPPTPLKSPLFYKWNPSKGSYFPKSLHRLILPETLSISYFYEVEMYKICPKVVYLTILTNLWNTLTHSKPFILPV